MNIIEAQASRSFTLKVAKADYRGEERYRPNEDIMVHASLKATIAPEEDPIAARRALQAMVDEDVRLGVEAARVEARARLEEATAVHVPRPPPLPKPLTAAENSLHAVQAATHLIQTTPNEAGIVAETRHELRRAALRVQELGGQDADAPVPKTQAEAEVLLRKLQNQLLALALPPQGGAVPPVNSIVRPAVSTTPPVVAPKTPPPGERAHCSNVTAHRALVVLDDSVAQYSLERHGRHLCRPCQVKA